MSDSSMISESAAAEKIILAWPARRKEVFTAGNVAVPDQLLEQHAPLLNVPSFKQLIKA